MASKIPGVAQPSADQGCQRGAPGKGRNRARGQTQTPPAPGQPGGRARRKTAQGPSQVHPRYKKGPRQVQRTSCNSRVPLPLWHLIPEQKMKKAPETRFLQMRGVPPGPAGARAAPSSPAARWPPARAFRRQPGVKDPAFTGAAPPPRHSSNGARPDLAGTARTAGRLVSAARRLLAVADALPVTVLAAIAGAGSFTHIRDTATQHGQHGLCPGLWRYAST
jgi:hypothetical protein